MTESDRSSERRRPYAGLMPEEREALRRVRLLSAALQLIGTRGYRGTTIEQLCSRAKVSTKSFYVTYPNKEALFLDLFDQVSKRSLTAAIGQFQAAEGRPIRERISAAVLAYAGPLVNDVRGARVVFVEVTGLSPAVEARRLAFREALISFVEVEGRAAVARGELQDRDFRFAAVCLAGAMNTSAYDWIQRADREPGPEWQRKFAAVAVHLLTG